MGALHTSASFYLCHNTALCSLNHLVHPVLLVFFPPLVHATSPTHPIPRSMLLLHSPLESPHSLSVWNSSGITYGGPLPCHPLLCCLRALWLRSCSLRPKLMQRWKPFLVLSITCHDSNPLRTVWMHALPFTYINIQVTAAIFLH